MPKRFLSEVGSRLEISVGVLLIMRQFIQNTTYTTEAGGILLGRMLLNSLDVVVDEVTVPMPGDRRTRHSYLRAKERHQEVIDRRWHESGGTCGYLGEWHTHPEPVPTPSSKDLRNWRKKLKLDVFDGDMLFFLIIGQKKICAWQGNKRTLEIIPMVADLSVRRYVWQKTNCQDLVLI